MVSVIVPVYNVAPYLKRCVDSLQNQTYRDLEIILVDDGSTDNSGQLCDEFASTDNRIRVIHKENGGLSDARNAGIKVAEGEYIGFLDSDDWVDTHMYEDMIRAALQYQAPLVITGMSRIYENGYRNNQFILEHEVVLSGDAIVSQYLKQGMFSTSVCDKLFRRDLLEHRCFPVGKLYEDAPVLFDVLCSIHKAVVLGKPHYCYFQRADSICGQKFSDKKMDHLYFSQDIRNRVKKDFPQLQTEADIFWCCKVCELLYSMLESDNASDFPDEKILLYSQLRQVPLKTCLDHSIPRIMRVKITLARMHLANTYNFLKKSLVIKGK